MRKKKIVFMHIPKTAGSSINNIFGNALGEQNCRFHIEWPLKRQNIRQIIENKTFISGHIYFDVIKELENENIIKFTLLREPYSHLVSHILWLDHYGMPEYEKEYQAFHKGMRDVIDFISHTDLGNPADLDYLLTNLPPWGIKHLNNCQTRYLIGQPENFTSLSLKAVPLAIKNLKLFDVYSSVENLKQVIKSVLKIYKGEDLTINNFDIQQKQNTKKSRRDIDITKPVFRSVLQKHILADLRVYNYAFSQSKLLI